MADGILYKNDPEIEDLIVSIILGIEKYDNYAKDSNKDTAGTKLIIKNKLTELDDFVWGVL